LFAWHAIPLIYLLFYAFHHKIPGKIKRQREALPHPQRNGGGTIFYYATINWGGLRQLLLFDATPGTTDSVDLLQVSLIQLACWISQSTTTLMDQDTVHGWAISMPPYW